MFIVVFNKKDKEKLILLGQKYVCEVKLDNSLAYMFDCDNKINFTEHDIRHIKTNRMTFGERR